MPMSSASTNRSSINGSGRAESMKQEVPAIRIFPMSDKIAGFRNRSIEDVQQKVFLGYFLTNDGRYRYRTAGLNSRAGTLVLFQFKARIIATAIFLHDEKFPKKVRDSAGELRFDPKSFTVFEPLDVAAMRKIWPSFRAFGHVKQYLNPTMLAKFQRSLKGVVKAKPKSR
jgi:hypothetical protein